MNAPQSSVPSQSTPQSPRPQRRLRRWIPYILATFFIALLVAGFWPKPVPVETAEVITGPLKATVSEEGKTRIRHRFVISAPVTGRLRRILLKPGSEIHGSNQVVAVIDPGAPTPLDARARALAMARKESALANLDRARAQHHFTSNDLVRLERLYREKTLSTQDFETAQWRDVSAAKEEVAAEAAVRQIDVELEDFLAGSTQSSQGNYGPVEVHAQLRGRVLRLFEESERTVTAGTPLIEVGDPADLEAVVEVLSRDGAAITPGTRVELDQWGGTEPLQGRVRLIEPSAFTKVSALGVEEQRVYVVVDLLTPPVVWSSLGDHFRIEGRVVLWETDKTLKAPSGALFRQGQQWATFVVEAGKARLRKVKVGRSSGQESQILDGLKEGDRLILYPGDRVLDGLSVKPIQL